MIANHDDLQGEERTVRIANIMIPRRREDWEDCIMIPRRREDWEDCKYA